MYVNQESQNGKGPASEVVHLETPQDEVLQVEQHPMMEAPLDTIPSSPFLKEGKIRADDTLELE